MLDDNLVDGQGNPILEANAQWTDTDLKDFIADALAEYSAHTATRKQVTLTGDGVVKAFTLASDFLQLGLLLDEDGNKLEPADLSPGSYLPSADDGNFRLYYIWPDGTLNLTWIPDAGETLTLHYWAYWAIPALDADVLTVPRWAERPLKYHMVGSAQMKRSTPTTLINEFRTRADSGTPMQNPLTAYAEWCFMQFFTSLDRHPVQGRDYWYQIG